MYCFSHPHLILNGYLFEIIFRIGFWLSREKNEISNCKFFIFWKFFSRIIVSVICLKMIILIVLKQFQFDFRFKKVVSLIENWNWNEKIKFFKWYSNRWLVSLIIVYDCCMCVLNVLKLFSLLLLFKIDSEIK